MILKRIRDLSLVLVKSFLYESKSISAHNFIKIFLLRTYVLTHNFEILCLPETYLDSSNSSNDNNLTIPGYDLYKADHPSNVKR